LGLALLFIVAVSGCGGAVLSSQAVWEPKSEQSNAEVYHTTPPPAPEAVSPYVTPPVRSAPIATPTPAPTPAPPFPDGFTYLRDVCADIAADLKYTTVHNFTGAVVGGYQDAAVIMSIEAANALALVQEGLRGQGLGLKVFDAYRPRRAVEAFIRWAEEPDDPEAKAAWYPNEDKASLFARGYIARRSAHLWGSTVDLTLIRLDTGAELDMGTPFDFLDPRAAHGAAGLTAEQRENRKLLKDAMAAHGFAAYSKEWWHYTLKPEPFPKTYFDFVVR